MDSQNRQKNNNRGEKLKKGSKHRTHVRYDIWGKIIKIKHQVCYIMITEVMILREDIQIDEEIRITYHCILNIT